jgi:hypothetical protein
MAAFFDQWHRHRNGAKALTVATAGAFEAVAAVAAAEVVVLAAAEVAVLAASCSSSPMAVDDVVVAERSFAALRLVGKVSATATHSDRWSVT